jgi:hypothetical protein
MKTRRQLAALEPMVFERLHGVPHDDWQKAPGDKWTIAQIVAHLAAGVDRSSAVLEERAAKKGMVRRTTPGQAVLRHLLLMVGKFPPRMEAPTATTPTERPDPDLVSAQFRMGVERFVTMAENWPPEHQLEVFVAHPFLGDLNLPEWVRFHYLHARHHSRQIRDRLKWLRRTSGSARAIG